MRGALFFFGGHVNAGLFEAFDQGEVRGLREELKDGLGDAGTDFFDALELFCAGFFEGVDGAELLGEQFGSAFADEADAEAHEDAREAGLFRFFNFIEQGARRFFSEVIEAGELHFSERVEIGDAFDELVIEQLLHDGIAEAFDVHDAAAAEVEERLAEFGGAVGVDAAIVNFAFDADDLAIALWAVGGECEGLVAAGMTGIFDDLDDFGDDVAAAFDFDRVVDFEAEPFNEVGVVEGGAADGGAADEDGGEFGDGGEFTGAANLDCDVAYDGDAGLGGEFVGDGPSWSAAGVAEPLLRLVRIDFEDDAIDFVAQVGAGGFGVVNEPAHGVDGMNAFAMGVDAKAEGGESFERGGLSGGEVLAFNEQEVGEEDEAAVGDDAGLEGAQSSGGGVAGIDEDREAIALALFIHALESFFGHDDFAADFECLGQFCLLEASGGDAEGYAADGADVGGDVFSSLSVAAGNS